MTELSVEYLIPCSIKIQHHTGDVTGVFVHTDDFNAVIPDQIYTGGIDNLPEYLPLDHPVAKRAVEIASRVVSRNGDVPLRFEVHE